jgi:hypothetical protein
MSKTGTEQKKRRTVVAVLALLVIVATVNARTFLTDKTKRITRPEVNQVELVVPDDLAEAALTATVHLTALRAATDINQQGLDAGPRTDNTGVVKAADRFAIPRDPFRPGPLAASSQLASSGRSSSGTLAKHVGPASSLACTAVMLGLGPPKARIGSHYVGIGDLVGGYRVVRIDREGALLQQDDRELFLPVGTESDAKTYHRPVTTATRTAAGR